MEISVKTEFRTLEIQQYYDEVPSSDEAYDTASTFPREAVLFGSCSANKLVKDLNWHIPTVICYQVIWKGIEVLQ